MMHSHPALASRGRGTSLPVCQPAASLPQAAPDPSLLTRVQHHVQVELLLQQQQAVVSKGAHVAQRDDL